MLKIIKILSLKSDFSLGKSYGWGGEELQVADFTKESDFY